MRSHPSLVRKGLVPWFEGLENHFHGLIEGAGVIGIYQARRFLCLVQPLIILGLSRASDGQPPPVFCASAQVVLTPAGRALISESALVLLRAKFLFASTC